MFPIYFQHFEILWKFNITFLAEINTFRLTKDHILATKRKGQISFKLRMTIILLGREDPRSNPLFSYDNWIYFQGRTKMKRPKKTNFMFSPFSSSTGGLLFIDISYMKTQIHGILLLREIMTLSLIWNYIS